MKKSMKILVLVAVVIIIAGIGIITANTILVGHIPVAVRNLEQTIELFDGVEYDIHTDKTTYQYGENITIMGTISNYDTTNKTIFCKGYIDFLNAEDGALYYISVYDNGYDLIWFEYAPTLDNSTNPIYTGLFGTYNFTLAPNAETRCIHTWNQTFGAFTPPSLYGTQVPPGTYHIVAELEIDWEYYHGTPFPMRHFRKETTITIEI